MLKTMWSTDGRDQRLFKRLKVLDPNLQEGLLTERLTNLQKKKGRPTPKGADLQKGIEKTWPGFDTTMQLQTPTS